MGLSLSEKNKLSVDEALESLRNKPIKSTMLERLVLIEKIDAELNGLPQPIKLGKGLGYILNNCSIPIKQHDLLLGRIPEVLPNEKEEEWLKKYYEKYRERPDWLVDGGHITFSWETLLKDGILGYIAKSSIQLEKCKRENAPQEKIDFLQGMVLVYKAYQSYMIRYANKAIEEGLDALGKTALNVCYNPPETFYEAMQLILFIGHPYSVYASVNSTLTYGRMDDYLREFYENDIKNGILTKNMAACIIDDFNCKNNLILGRGEHQMSGDEETDTGWFRNPTYDTPQYIVLGGYSNLSDHTNNPLTELFVERICKRFENPFFVFRYTKETNDNIWSKLCDKIRQNSSIMVYNDDVTVDAFVKSGIEKKDAIDYTMHGCNWPDIPGKYATIQTTHCLMVQRILDVLLDKNGNLSKNFDNINQIYEQLFKTYKADMLMAKQEYKKIISGFSDVLPTRLSCTDCFTDGCIENAAAMYQGAVKYNVIYNLIRNIGTAADIMAAIEFVVYKEKKASLIDMIKAIQADFNGFDELLNYCLKSPKYGADNDLADYAAKRLMEGFTNVVDEISVNEKGEIDTIVFNITTTDMWHIADGLAMIATPNGRRKGEPISENLSPTAGVTNAGLTSLLNSVTSLPFNRIHSGAFNLRVRKDWVLNDKGLELLKVLLKTYFKNGGMQFQISVADTKDLIDAQINPSKYRDLMVRITGYSAVFVDMSKKAQDEFIRRDQLGV